MEPETHIPKITIKMLKITMLTITILLVNNGDDEGNADNYDADD